MQELQTWQCARCNSVLIDTDIHPYINPKDFPFGIDGQEPQEFYVEGFICNYCAQKLGIAFLPDEEE